MKLLNIKLTLSSKNTSCQFSKLNISVILYAELLSIFRL